MTYTLDEEDEIGTLMTIADQAVLVDRYGYALYLKHGEGKGGWKFNFSIPMLHRRYVDENLIPRIVLFHRELLGLLEDSRHVRFRNGDYLDLRIINLSF